MSTSGNSEKLNCGSRWKNALRNLALSAGVFLLCVGAFELVLRSIGYGNLEIYESDPRLYWRLKPNQRCFTKVNRQPVRVNAHGTRGPEFSVAKPPGTFRILNIGDSKTFGWGVGEDQTYSAVLGRVLHERFPGKSFEVINGGVNAWSYSQMSVFLRERAVAWQPDVVIVGDANPWTQFSEQPPPEFLKKILWRVRAKNFLRRFALFHYVVEFKLRDVYEHQRKNFVPVDPKQDELFKEQQRDDPDAIFRDAIERICSTALSNRIRPLLLYVPFQDAILATNVSMDGALRVKRQMSGQFGVRLLDATEDLRPQAKDLYLEGDTVHLNAVGHEIIGRRLADVVSPLLKQ